jgi:alkanesulfonate monooxygenase SsuD/methylene tetrahydromethanopterin reductase-like flavin-dependent oxidoreductase (luciferase family)
MRVSLFYNVDALPEQPTGELYQQIERQVVLADTLGFDTVWVAEHHFALYGRVAAPLLFLARLSALTQRIRLGTAVIEAPYYHPLRLAEEAALLDQLSAGRLCLGVGSGARNKPAEFAHFGVLIDEKSQRTREILAMLDQAFTHGRIDYAGSFYQHHDVPIAPRPLQATTDLLWVAASDALVEEAGRAGYGLLVPRVGDPLAHGALIARYRAAGTTSHGQIAALRYLSVAETEREAREQSRRTLIRYARYDLGVDWDGDIESSTYEELVRRLNCFVGTLEQVFEQISAWQAVHRVDELICQVFAAGSSPSSAIRVIEQIAQNLAPHLRALEGGS